MTEKTITLMGQQVRMIYCAASETGYENLSGLSSERFTAHRKLDEEGKPVTDEDGNPVIEPAEAVLDDYLKLAIASIIAAYSKEGKEPPITPSDIMYDAKPADIQTLVTTVAELRQQWYHVPDIIGEEPSAKDEDDGQAKNA